MINCTIWQADNAEKILRDKSYEPKNTEVFLGCQYQNEYEGVQVILTPEYDVKSFSVKCDVLKNGEYCIPSSNIDVFVAKYVEITKPTLGTEHDELGYYPDALLPMAVSESYKENTIKAGDNQFVWIRVKTEKTTPQGVYKGKISITINDEIIEKTIEITVWDFALPTKNHTRQHFHISNRQLLLGEGSKSLDMIERYYDGALQYRINGNNMPFNHRVETFEEGLKNWLLAYKKYYQDERVSYLNIRWLINDECDDLDYEKADKMFTALADLSIADGVNYFDKAITYIWIFDEPSLNKKTKENCQRIIPVFSRFKKRIANKYRDMSELAFYQDLADKIEKIPNIITSVVNADILTDEEMITWCPPFSAPTNEENNLMQQTLNKGEKWWYGCNWPVRPNPSYHIDEPLLSPRILSWMQFKYNVTGNLYWRLNFWCIKENGEFKFVDPYKEAPNYNGAHGDGYLVYPGAKYKLDNFVPSIRLEAIRDGIEDYEALYSLRELWIENAANFDVKSEDVNIVLEPIYTRLFDRTQMLKKSLMPFDEARAMIAKLLIVSNRYGFAVTKFDEKEKILRFVSNAEQIEVKGGELSKTGKEYCLKAEDEKVEIVFDSQTACALYSSSIFRPKKYALSNCWAQTAEKYGVTDATAENILKPYFDILNGADESHYNQCCRDLSRLVLLVWKAETLIKKERCENGWLVTLIVPKGDFNSSEPYNACKLDEDAKAYEIRTEKTSIEIEVQNAIGVFKTNLYLI